MKLATFFSGAGGLDLGFRQAGFEAVWANEFNKNIWATYEYNHKGTELCRKSITDIDAGEVPDCDGIIGGPPCQSWSSAGSKRGIEDRRGQLFFNFIRLLTAKQPKFFLAENVSGMLADKHSEALANIKSMFDKAGYDLYFELLNASDYGVAQDRKRVFFVGFRKDLHIDTFNFPEPETVKKTLSDAIGDLHGRAVPALAGNKPNPNALIDSHEYFIGDFSSMYMSRNRVRSWDEQSFTIQASGRHAPIHPSFPKMVRVDKDRFEFGDSEFPYRRLTVRECARVQGFPDDFKFIYNRVDDGYKMVGNAVPVLLARRIAESIKNVLDDNYAGG